MRYSLSLSGGGIRALVSLQILKYVEERVGPARTRYDFITGTSTGGILAIALAQGYSAVEIERFYVENAAQIFPSRACSTVRDLTSPKYDGVALTRLLQQLLVRPEWPCAYVTAYDTQAQALRVLGKQYGPAWLRARATSAAPTYFPPVRFGDACLVDGGIIENDPVLVCAGMSDPARTHHLSLGTGRRPIALSYEQCSGWGALSWVAPLIDAMLTGSQGGAEYCASRLLPHYLPLDCALPAGAEKMDATSQHALQRLQALGQQLVLERTAELDTYCAEMLAQPQVRR